ncbi:MAG TPA: hypothetical protein VII16_15410 [Actinomycetes bacterium]
MFEDPAAQVDGLVEDNEGSDDEPGPEANIGAPSGVRDRRGARTRDTP